MFKRIYKTLSTTLLILAMLNLQITPVYAQANNDEENINEDSREAREAARESNQSGEGEGSSEDGEGDEMLSKMMSVSTDDVNVHIGDMLTYLALIAVGLFLITIWDFQKMSLDMQIGMGAGILQVASVISTITATRAKIDGADYKIEKKEDGSVNNMQVDALKKQRESYVALKDHAALKWKIEAAGAAAYAGAAAVAAYDAWKINSLITSCGAALKAAGTTAGNCMAAEGNVGLIGENLKNTEGTSGSRLSYRAELLKLVTTQLKACTGESSTLNQSVIVPINTSCNPLVQHLSVEEPIAKAPSPDSSESGSFLNFKKMFKKQLRDIELPDFQENYVLADHILPGQLMGRNLPIPTSAYQELHFLGSYPVGAHFRAPYLNPHPEVFDDVEGFKEKIVSLVFPQAHALDMQSAKWLGLGTAALLAFWAFREALVEFLDQYMTYPGYRSVLYLAASAVSSASAYLTYSAMGQAEDNIERIDEMLEKLDSLQDMGNTEQRLQQQDLNLAGGLKPMDRTPEVPLTDGDDPISCNRPLQNGKCPSMERGLRRSRGFQGLDPQLGNIGTLATGIADDITGSSSLSGGTVDKIDNLADKNAIARRALRQLESMENKKRKENGQKPVDYSKQANSLMGRLAKVGEGALNSKGSSAGGLLAAMGYPESMRGEGEGGKKKITGELKNSSGVAATKNNRPSGSSEEEDEFVFDFGEEEEEEGEIFEGDLENYDTSVYAQAFDAQAVKGSDQIVGDRDVSIFRVISVRYMKSGLPRLLNELGDRSNALEELE